MLLDECVPKRLRREIAGHHVKTVPEMGWASRKNGDLLRVAETLFDVLITTDQRLSYQQHVPRYSLGIVVMVARRNKLEFLLPLVPTLLTTLAEIQPGEVRRIGGDRLP